MLTGQQQAIPQVAPTQLQMLTVQYTAEQMIKEESGKRCMPSPDYNILHVHCSEENPCSNTKRVHACRIPVVTRMFCNRASVSRHIAKCVSHALNTLANILRKSIHRNMTTGWHVATV